MLRTFQMPLVNGVFQFVFLTGFLGLGGKASKNKLKDTSFIFPITNVIILGVFRPLYSYAVNTGE